eukprot:gene12359-13511_t
MMFFQLIVVFASLNHITGQTISQIESLPICITGATPFRVADECAPGWYCPLYQASNSSTYPVQCAATDDCLLDRLKTEFCDRQGRYEPLLCEKGYYCPNPSEQIKCPKDYFCPMGQYEPISCGPLTSCPEGSDKRTDYSSLVAIVVTDVGVVLIWWLRRMFKHYNKAKDSITPKDVAVEEDGVQDFQQIEEGKDSDRTISPDTLKLCEGFIRAQGTLPPMQIKFTEMSLTIPPQNQSSKSKTVLKGVTGSIEPGKVTAIMGPSGAGKTTFLNTVLGKVDPSWERGGVLQINGVHENLLRFRKIIGYVPQEDIMHRDLTVRENITYSAMIRLPRHWTAAERDDHINATIAAVKLSHVEDVPIGDEVRRGISGGQRKRCNIGIELAAAPLFLVLDEPTSGLDSTSAMDICQVLKDLAANAGITVAMVIHQPRIEIWEQLDQLLLLAPGGLTVYQGPQKLASAYFEQSCGVALKPGENPGDALMDRIAEQASSLVDAWSKEGENQVALLLKESNDYRISRQSDYLTSRRSDKGSGKEKGYAAVNGSEGSDYPPFPPGEFRVNAHFLKQIYLSIVRNLWKQLASPPYLEMGLALLAGGLMGDLVEVKYQGVLSSPYTLFSPTPLEGAIGSFFNSVGLALSLASASAGVSVFGEEMHIYGREVATGHNHLGYFLGTNIAQLPKIFVAGLHFAFIFHIINQCLTPFRTFFPIAFLLYFAIYGLACIVSMLVSRKNAPLLAVVVSLFFASMTQKGGFPEGIQYFSASRWATEAIFTKESEPFLHIMEVKDVSAHNAGYKLNR